ncbi:MAG: hypothetical protein LBV30_11050 [Propionibacteriaceae bacterium]|nr:hypothetical protein [Propionibacteriaceae bacterium]
MDTDPFDSPRPADSARDNRTPYRDQIHWMSRPVESRTERIHIEVGTDDDGGFIEISGPKSWRQPLRRQVSLTIGQTSQDPDSVELIASMMSGLLNPPYIAPPAVTASLKPFHWLLERAKNGLALTQAGYLKPVDVVALSEILPMARDFPGKHNREDQTWPVRDFRNMLMHYQLLRRHKDALVLTPLGRNAVENSSWLWLWLAWSVIDAEGSSIGRDAVILNLAFAAGGVNGDQEKISRMLTAIGWRANHTEPIDAFITNESLSHYDTIIKSIDAEATYFEDQETAPSIVRHFAQLALTMRAAPAKAR